MCVFFVDSLHQITLEGEINHLWIEHLDQTKQSFSPASGLETSLVALCSVLYFSALNFNFKEKIIKLKTWRTHSKRETVRDTDLWTDISCHHCLQISTLGLNSQEWTSVVLSILGFYAVFSFTFCFHILTVSFIVSVVHGDCFLDNHNKCIMHCPY